jgi:glycerophosphoryl diester phosphodiesterase
MRSTIIAHRGGQPENTLAAFRSAPNLGADAVECDVHVTVDGIPMVFHDFTLDHLTDATGNWLNLKRDDVKTLCIRGTFERIPELRETLATLTCPLFLELKSPELPGGPSEYPQMVEVVLSEIETSDQAIVILAFDWELLRRFKKHNPHIATGMLVDREELRKFISPETTQINLSTCQDLIGLANEFDCSWIDVNHELVSLDQLDMILSAIHTASKKLAVWTVNDTIKLRQFLQAKVDAITTDYPEVAYSIRATLP